MVRDVVRQLGQLGPLPHSDSASDEQLNRYEEFFESVTQPVTDDEARILVRLFGPDDCYGLAWTILHLVESAPGWPLRDCLEGSGNEWIERLRQRAARA